MNNIINDSLKAKEIDSLEKISGESLDIVKQNVLKLKELFPEVFTEGKIDFDRLQDVLGNYIDDKDEKYRFEWHGKTKAIKISQTPSRGTLRPCKEESKNWDTTENLYIEGDNLEVLKLLQKTYQGKIKMIYIDPPYNTGNDFVYPDNYSDNLENYLEITSQIDEEGNKLSTNSESSGSYHTKWLNMIYPRLRLARNLLNEKGVIFISIGDTELANLKKISDEIFGSDNCVGVISRLMKTGGNKGRFFSPNIDYILVYAKQITSLDNFKGELDKNLIDKLYNKVETEGIRKGERYRPFGLYQSSLDSRPNQRYYIQCPDGSLVIPPGKTMPEKLIDGYKVIPNKEDGCWRWSNERYLEERDKGNIVFIKSKNGVLINSDGSKSNWNVYTKIWLSDREEEGQIPTNFISKFENRHSAKELKGLDIEFDFAKPTELIKYLISFANNDKKSIILDFFSGSATTADAVMQLNVEDFGERKFIMVQLPEPCDKKLESYKNICEIGKERIRRAGDKIVEENKDKDGIEDLDIGFKVFKLDTSNIKPWNPDYDNLEMTLEDTIDNFIPGRTQEDVVYEIMLKYGIDLTYPIDVKEVGKKKLFSIGFGALLICLDDDITLDEVNEIVKLRNELNPKTCRVVFRDNGFKTDSVKTNAIEILRRNNIKEIMSI